MRLAFEGVGGRSETALEEEAEEEHDTSPSSRRWEISPSRDPKHSRIAQNSARASMPNRAPGASNQRKAAPERPPTRHLPRPTPTLKKQRQDPHQRTIPGPIPKHFWTANSHRREIAIATSTLFLRPKTFPHAIFDFCRQPVGLVSAPE